MSWKKKGNVRTNWYGRKMTATGRGERIHVYIFDEWSLLSLIIKRVYLTTPIFLFDGKIVILDNNIFVNL